MRATTLSQKSKQNIDWVAFVGFSRGGVEDTRLEAKAKDIKKIRGQGQGQPFRGQTLSRPRTECSRPRPRTKDTSASALQKKKKGLHKNFSGDLKKKNVFQKIFQVLHKILTIQKMLLSSSRGQANFRGLEVSRPRPRTWPSRPRPRTSKSVLEAKDVLKDSTSGVQFDLLAKIRLASSRLQITFHCQTDGPANSLHTSAYYSENEG